jgi:hypothetical protein
MGACRAVSSCDVVELLEQWGAWSCSGLGSGGLGTPSYDNVHWITDDIALWVERSVCELGKSDEAKKLSGVKCLSRRKAILLVYRERYNVPMLAKSLKVGETKAKTILLLAESWIEGYLQLHSLNAA